MIKSVEAAWARLYDSATLIAIGRITPPRARPPPRMARPVRLDPGLHAKVQVVSWAAGRGLRTSLAHAISRDLIESLRSLRQPRLAHAVEIVIQVLLIWVRLLFCPIRYGELGIELENFACLGPGLLGSA